MGYDYLAEIKKIQEHYRNDPTAGSFNALIMGDSGTGKTFGVASTAPGPIHIDSFDKGGCKGIGHLVKSGKVVVDSRWEHDDPFNPSAFLAWESEMNKRIKGGYFDHFKMYILDGLTTWSSAIMYQVLKKAGIPGQIPRRNHDYMPQKNAVLNWVNKILLLPCNTVLTAHLKPQTNSDGATTSMNLMAVGDAAIRLPLLFDEQWVTFTKPTSKDPEYKILLGTKGLLKARSRLKADGKLNNEEPMDVTALLKKAGFDFDSGEMFTP